MAIPQVNLRKIKRTKGYVFMLDFSINGRRIREVVGLLWYSIQNDYSYIILKSLPKSTPAI